MNSEAEMEITNCAFIANGTNGIQLGVVYPTSCTITHSISAQNGGSQFHAVANVTGSVTYDGFTAVGGSAAALINFAAQSAGMGTFDLTDCILVDGTGSAFRIQPDGTVPGGHHRGIGGRCWVVGGF